MIKKENFFTNEFAYFVGVMQGDGSYGTYIDRVKNKFRTCLTLCAIDLEMVEKSVKIFNETFHKNVTIYRRKKDNLFGFSTSVKNLIEVFNKLEIDFHDPPKPPLWIKNNIEYFGSYLARNNRF